MSSPVTQTARDFTTLHKHGVLSTISKKFPDYPFGSLTPYDIGTDGVLIIYISLISQHYLNLEQNWRASMIVLDPFGAHDPQAHARCTLLLDFKPVPEAKQPAMMERYRSRFPNSSAYDLAHNFVLMQGTPVQVRWIGGFGEIAWVDAEAFRTTIPDPLAYSGLEIINHMNEDHRDALVDYARAFLDCSPNPEQITLVHVDARGLTLQLNQANGITRHQIAFSEKLTCAAEARAATIELLRQARLKLNAG